MLIIQPITWIGAENVQLTRLIGVVSCDLEDREMGFGMTAEQRMRRLPVKEAPVAPEQRKRANRDRWLEKQRLQRAHVKAGVRRKALCCPHCGAGLRGWLRETWFPKRRQMAWWLGLGEQATDAPKQRERVKDRERKLLEAWREKQRKKGKG